MTEFERSVPQFRGGSINGENIDKNSFIELFADVFDTLLYKELQAQSSSKSIDRAYTDNQSFWNDALKGLHFQSMHLQLQGFHLTEWIPSAPGRYFTSDAEKSREEAQRYINPHFEEYLPVGKEYMVLGGVGSVRLKAKSINSKNTYFLGASSTGISHQGIPIALLEAEYRQVIQTIKSHGGCFANLVGTLQILPISMALIHYDRKVPRYCLFLDNIEVLRPSSTSELLTTVAIVFPSDHSYYSPGHYSHKSHKQGHTFSKGDYTTALLKTWSFTSFCPSSIDSLNAAIDWLKSYASRHSFMNNPSILNDFDEHYQHFDIPVEFPISQMFSGSIDPERIKAYQSYYGFNVNIQELNLIDKRKGAFVSNDQYRIAGLSGNTNVGAESKVKVLFLAANPLGTDRLKLDEEIRAITEKVYASEYRDYLQVESSWAIRPDDLLQLLNRHRPHIIHFSGHGSQTGELILVDNTGSPKAVSTMALKALFTTLKDNIQVVILNACYSRSQATAISEIINCVVGMNDAIGEEAAIIFAASFYRALGFGRSVQEAFEQGKVALLLEGIPEENTPELLFRTGVNPSQVSLVEQPKEKQQINQEQQHHSALLRKLKTEYILSHPNVNERILVGTEPLPKEWVERRLEEMGETWRQDVYPS